MVPFSKEHDKLHHLALEMQKGNSLAAEKIYKELSGKVFGFCVTRTGHRATAEDLTQDIFLKLVNRIDSFDPEKGTFSVWFWQLVRNTVIDSFRKHKETVFSDYTNEDDEFDVPQENRQDTQLDTKAEYERVKEFLLTLSGEEQELFQLRFVSELSYKEIATMTDKSEGALRVAISRLKEKIHIKFKS